ncbi:MAG: phosphopyruvate hydratase [Eubacteriales bacterium]|nr:phosphopyruvate hydratase [Eubacteriales bacterium]
MFYIEEVVGREVLDSRGNPTVEAEVMLGCGARGRGIAPSGASTGEFEALELRDKDANRYQGKGVLNAVKNINTLIKEALEDREFKGIYELDKVLLDLDGTENKSKLGANAMLAVSLAAAHAMANCLEQPLYKFLGGEQAVILPVPMMNILNGGCHATNNIDAQEFMIMPVGATSFREGLRMCAEVYHTLAALLKADGHNVSVGDEGGFAPNLNSIEEALDYILRAIREAGYQEREDFMLAMDPAASEWKSGQTGEYLLPKTQVRYTSEELVAYWKGLCEKYPIASMEDGCDEEDWNGFALMTKEMGERIQIVGDDLFVTNGKRLARGIKEQSANSILIKLNQIGTVSETLDTMRMAHKANFTTVISHRSGETEDVTIADLAVAVNAGQIKTGAPCRTERVAKYNRLLRIEEELGDAAVYAGKSCFNTKRND